MLKELDTLDAQLIQANLEMKAMRTLYAKDAQELIKHRVFKKRFDEMLAARKNEEKL